MLKSVPCRRLSGDLLSLLPELLGFVGDSPQPLLHFKNFIFFPLELALQDHSCIIHGLFRIFALGCMVRLPMSPTPSNKVP